MTCWKCAWLPGVRPVGGNAPLFWAEPLSCGAGGSSAGGFFEQAVRARALAATAMIARRFILLLLFVSIALRMIPATAPSGTTRLR
jgi:hypothetical protein